jgi:hypothetical protein
MLNQSNHNVPGGVLPLSFDSVFEEKKNKLRSTQAQIEYAPIIIMKGDDHIRSVYDLGLDYLGYDASLGVRIYDTRKALLRASLVQGRVTSQTPTSIQAFYLLDPDSRTGLPSQPFVKRSQGKFIFNLLLQDDHNATLPNPLLTYRLTGRDGNSYYSSSILSLTKNNPNSSLLKITRAFHSLTIDPITEANHIATAVNDSMANQASERHDSSASLLTSGAVSLLFSATALKLTGSDVLHVPKPTVDFLTSRLRTTTFRNVKRLR